MDGMPGDEQETSKRNGVLQVGTSVGLSAHVREHLDLGCREVGWMLGIKEMPEGYALMLDADDMYFYWLRYDGVQSVISWDKWAAYRGARDDAKAGT